MNSRYEDSILRSLQRIIQATNQHSHKLARSVQLTSPQLTCLKEIQEHHNITPSELARQVSLSRPTVTGILDRLTSRALIARSPHPSDKRRTVLTLTPAGHDILKTAPSALQGHLATNLGQLHDGEQALIDWVLQRIVSLMDEDPQTGAPGPDGPFQPTKSNHTTK